MEKEKKKKKKESEGEGEGEEEEERVGDSYSSFLFSLLKVKQTIFPEELFSHPSPLLYSCTICFFFISLFFFHFNSFLFQFSFHFKIKFLSFTFLLSSSFSLFLSLSNQRVSREKVIFSPSLSKQLGYADTSQFLKKISGATQRENLRAILGTHSLSLSLSLKEQ